MIEQRQAAGPYIGAEIRSAQRQARTGKNGAHCGGSIDTFPYPTTSTEQSPPRARVISMVLPYSTWYDQSPPLGSFLPQPVVSSSPVDTPPLCILVGKDYRLTNTSTVLSMFADVANFKHEHGCNINDEKNCCSYLHERLNIPPKCDYILDVAEGDEFPDAQVFLVTSDDDNVDVETGCESISYRRRCFYSRKFYLALSCIFLDSIYCLLFLVATRDAGDYYVVKYIGRN